MRARFAVALFAAVLAGCPQWHDAPLSRDVQRSGGGEHPATPSGPAAPEWSALATCAGVTIPPPDATLRAQHVVDGLEEASSCWLHPDELAALDEHRRELSPVGDGERAAYVAADRAARTLAADALSAAGRSDDAAALRHLPEVVDEESRAAVEHALRELVPDELLHGALPPPGQTVYVPTIVLDDGHGCTLAHLPAGSTSTAADAAVAMAVQTLVNAAKRPPQTVQVQVTNGDQHAQAPVTVTFDVRNMFHGIVQGASTVACFAAMIGEDGREQAVDDLLETMTLMTTEPTATTE